jgi:uncharacterized HAD superfamily protein
MDLKMKNNLHLKIIAVDLDKTLTQKTSWNIKQALTAKPRKDIIKKINELYKHNLIIIHTSRTDDLYDATRKWLKKNNVKYHAISMEKMVADYYIDDKALRPEEI